MDTQKNQLSTTDDARDADVVDRLLAARFSCRGFLPQAVPRAITERILMLAQRSASWCNSQAWQTVVTSGAGTEKFREALLAHVTTHDPRPDFEWPREYTGVYRDRRRECGFALYAQVGVAKGDREGAQRQAMENYRFFGAPHVAIVTSPASLGIYGGIDCGGYIANFMLAAQSLGVATIAQASLASHPGFIREYFGLPDDRLVVCGVSFGYEDPGHPANGFRTRREDLRNVAIWRDY